MPGKSKPCNASTAAARPTTPAPVQTSAAKHQVWVDNAGVSKLLAVPFPGSQTAWCIKRNTPLQLMRVRADDCLIFLQMSCLEQTGTGRENDNLQQVRYGRWQLCVLIY